MLKRNEMTSKLLQLVAENPELPIVPMVFYEVVGGDCGDWIGKVIDVKIREYAIDEWEGDGSVRFRDDFGAEEILIESIAELKYDGTDEDYKKAKEEAAALWEKAIIVYIGGI